MKFFSRFVILFLSMFLNMCGSIELETAIKEEYEKQLEITVRNALREMNPSMLEKALSDFGTALVMTLIAMTTGVAMVCCICGDVRRYTHSEEELQFYLLKSGLLFFVGYCWSIFLLGAVDKKIIRPVIDSKSKFEMLKSIKSLLEGLDSDSSEELLSEVRRALG